MSKYSVGDNERIKYRETGEEIDVVITAVEIIDGHNCYMVRRKDNKQFKRKNPDRYSFNAWLKGEKVEVINDAPTK